jgi:hypothetical protein
VLPGTFNIVCSTVFGGHYHDLYDTTDDDFPSRFTTRRALAFLKLHRGQDFLSSERTGYWSFPAQVIRVNVGSMLVKQCVLEGCDDGYAEPDLSDVEIKIVLEPEVKEFVYVYDLAVDKLMTGGCLSRRSGIVCQMGLGTWIKLRYFDS